MEHYSSLVEVLHNKKIDRKVRLLITLNAIGEGTSVAGIKDFAMSHGAKDILKWNISDILSKTEGLAFHSGKLWKISRAGERYLQMEGFDSAVEEVPAPIILLEKHVSSLQSDQVRKFVKEAVEAAKHGLHRSAVVLSWVGAVAVLRDHIVEHELSDFNHAMKLRFPKLKKILNQKHMTKLQEGDFLQLLEDIAFIDKNVKKQLTQRLDLRNDCGHPNDLELGPSQVASHIEQLVLNVYAKYG